MSDTPRTDKHLDLINCDAMSDSITEWLFFARTLERELAEAKAKVPNRTLQEMLWEHSQQVNSLRAELLKSQAECAEMKKYKVRYEFIRRLSPRAFGDIWCKNIEGVEHFNKLIDQAIAAKDK